MFDSAGAFGRGAAYSPASDFCLLNVRAKAMGAFPDDEGHFLAWLRRTGYGRDDADLGNRFLPRKLYGAYLSNMLAACRDTGNLHERTDRIVDLHRDGDGYELVDGSGSRTFAKTVVLALGNLPPGGLGDSALNGAMRDHALPAWRLLASGSVDPDAGVLVVGTGLTALDVMLHLASNGHRGRIDMLSRHGRFPLPHAPPPLAHAATPADILAGRPQDAMRALRRFVRDCESRGQTWHDAIDAIRPHVSSVWQRWTPAQREQFFRHAAPYWEVHRHRAPTSTLEVRDALLASGQLHVHAGRLYALEAEGGRLCARFVDRRIGRSSELRVDVVVDCTGPRRDYRRSGDPLVEALFDRSLATTDPLGLGFAALPSGAMVDGDGHKTGIFTLGTPLRGMLFESGAVREVRVQAEAVARSVIDALQSDAASRV